MTTVFFVNVENVALFEKYASMKNFLNFCYNTELNNLCRNKSVYVSYSSSERLRIVHLGFPPRSSSVSKMPNLLQISNKACFEPSIYLKGGELSFHFLTA